MNYSYFIRKDVLFPINSFIQLDLLPSCFYFFTVNCDLVRNVLLISSCHNDVIVNEVLNLY